MADTTNYVSPEINTPHAGGSLQDASLTFQNEVTAANQGAFELGGQPEVNNVDRVIDQANLEGIIDGLQEYGRYVESGNGDHFSGFADAAERHAADIAGVYQNPHNECLSPIRKADGGIDFTLRRGATADSITFRGQPVSTVMTMAKYDWDELPNGSAQDILKTQFCKLGTNSSNEELDIVIARKGCVPGSNPLYTTKNRLTGQDDFRLSTAPDIMDIPYPKPYAGDILKKMNADAITFSSETQKSVAAQGLNFMS